MANEIPIVAACRSTNYKLRLFHIVRIILGESRRNSPQKFQLWPQPGIRVGTVAGVARLQENSRRPKFWRIRLP
jgi:hypothetical protein